MHKDKLASKYSAKAATPCHKVSLSAPKVGAFYRRAPSTRVLCCPRWHSVLAFSISGEPLWAVFNELTGELSGTLSWTPPTENEDGTPLMDLAGYRVYWGQSPGTYEFVATSLNGAGVESRFSNAITKIVQ